MNSMTEPLTGRLDFESVVALFKSNRFIQLMTVLLLAQLALAILFSFTGRQASFASGEPLFALKKEDIKSVGIDDGEKSTTMTWNEAGWQLEGNVPLPVDSTRIEALLNSLVNLEVGLPVASSLNSRDQLDVADKDYQRKLVVNDDERTTFLIGTSPGLRKAHLRRAGENSIYSAALQVSDMPTTKERWIEPTLLAMTDISGVSSNSVSFQREGTGDDAAWVAEGQKKEDKAVHAEKISDLISTLESLRVTGLAEKSDSKSDSTVSFSIESGTSMFNLELTKSKNDATIRRNDIDQTFSISIASFDKLFELLPQESWLTEEGDE